MNDFCYLLSQMCLSTQQILKIEALKTHKDFKELNNTQSWPFLETSPGSILLIIRYSKRAPMSPKMWRPGCEWIKSLERNYTPKQKKKKLQFSILTFFLPSVYPMRKSKKYLTLL